jgi:hypothetical protein
VRQLIDVVGFPCQLADSVGILPVQPWRYLCRNDRLPDVLADGQTGFSGSLLDSVILKLGQLCTDYSLLFVYPALCRATSCLVPYLCHTFCLLNGIFKIATNGRNFLCCQAKQGVSVYRNITLLS